MPNPHNADALWALPMNLFPTLDSVEEVIELAYSKLPITDRNELYSLLMTFQNTLLKENTP